ncbi:2-keto-3-deoxy-6-phosphogluconate aldolase [Synechococcus sp. RS9909]|uniref:bifunctional 4-hydroxy-2-oxoglutarate aldolase/2-dehydro-3-deoxy-phosphogluconate aldolase n=1 Tax=unclassified Synechococcus TaxID=2626047 RepID=UPI0000690930|nr:MULTISPECIES: bifunctional 4-hydroxy-2-oxoglutarate aldolase/2-dehydro-3-deoxy-phosphogluconate aldolase [unclassified Synechococcus]EAQ68630.1 putative aldolase [Synechococcus sp. RS9917]QNI78461.1 2-keto-3-deoxy-6-phosphogluconate aldolase [Synechococcus sp. RS9909]
MADHSRWRKRQRELIVSLRSHPLLMVFRPDPADLSAIDVSRTRLCGWIDQLSDRGVRHVELAWSNSPQWPDLIRALQQRHPRLSIGAASIRCQRALEQAAELGLTYAMSPCLDEVLLALARRLDLVLVPGVMTPSEIHRAVTCGCELVKLFPAASLGIDYHRLLAAPMAPLPFMIAAGGLRADGLRAWLAAGYDAIALGRSAIVAEGLDPALDEWLT